MPYSQADQEFAEKTQQRNGTTREPMAPDMVLARDITPRVLQYLHWPYIVQRRVNLVIGNPGVGKGLWTVDLGRAVSTGGLLPDQQGAPTIQAPSGDVIFLSAEDGYEDGLRPRLDAAKADLDRVRILRGKKNTKEETLPITFDDIAIIEQAVQNATNPKLVVIDPVTAYMGQRDINKSGDVAPIMDALRTLATTYTLAVVLVAHPRKPRCPIAPFTAPWAASPSLGASAQP